jgi:ribonuclease P protein component
MPSLRGRTQFENVSRVGKRFARNFLQLRILPNSLESNRLGIIIPAKAVRKACERNRIKRLIKEAYRSLHISGESGYDILLIVRGFPAFDNMLYVRGELTGLLKSAGLVNSNS